MSGGKEERPAHIFRSSTNAESVRAYGGRFDGSGKVLSGYFIVVAVISSIAIFGGAAMLAFFIFPPVSIIFILGGIATIAFVTYAALRKKDMASESADYYIESFPDHLVLHSGVKEPRTIAHSDILRMEKFSRELAIFKDNDISATFEQAQYPYIHVAAGNEHLYKLIYARDRKKKEVVVDIYDLQQFELIVFHGDSKFKGSRTDPLKKKIKLTCPQCEYDFEADGDAKVLKCPKCGVKGKI